jgi:hypothetical protein
MYVHQVSEKSKYLQKPYDQDNYDNKVEDFLDLVIHGDESVDNP